MPRLPRLGASTFPARRSVRGGAVEQPKISVGTPTEYAFWVSRLRNFLRRRGARPVELEQVDARYNFETNRIILYRLADGSCELSVAETLSHEVLHSLLEQLGEHYAARAIDLVSRRSGTPPGSEGSEGSSSPTSARIAAASALSIGGDVGNYQLRKAWACCLRAAFV